MNTQDTFCVCGGGNMGHAIAAYLAYKGRKVSVLTRRASDWSSSISATLPDGRHISGPLHQVSEDPAAAADARIVLITVPKFGFAEVLEHIQPHLSRGQALVAVPGGAGCDWMTRELLGRGVSVLGFQRVPFIARTTEYGRSVNIQGLKKELKMAVLPVRAFGQFQASIEDAFDTPIKQISSFLGITLNNSNPLLHPARITTLFSDWKPGMAYSANPLFYEGWDDRASEALISADAELMAICARFPEVSRDVMPICEYYGVSGVSSLTAKIRSITAFKGIKSPMTSNGVGWTPDFSSRYFTEDIPYGTVPIKAIAEVARVRTPTLDRFIEWVQERMALNLIGNGALVRDGCAGLPVPWNYGLLSFDSLCSNDWACGADDSQEPRAAAWAP